MKNLNVRESEETAREPTPEERQKAPVDVPALETTERKTSACARAAQDSFRFKL